MGSDQPHVFISHSWKDKPLARRVARRLAHRGVPTWFDEGELQLGDQLPLQIQKEIESASHLLLLWSPSAAESAWVRKEVMLARAVQPPVTVVPVRLQEGLSDPLFDEYLGISLIDPHRLEADLERLAQALLGHPPDTARDIQRLGADLRALANEAPDLRPLIEQLSQEGRITHAQIAAAHITPAARHEAETALIVLHEYLDADANARYVVSLVAAQFLLEYGVGYAVLERQLARETPRSGNLEIMVHALGGRCADRSYIDPTIAFLLQIRPPPDLAFCAFIRANFDQMDEAQQNRAVAFAITPNRGPAGFASELAFELYRRMPENRALQQLWYWWIQTYQFGGKEGVEGMEHPERFFGYLNAARREQLSQFEPLIRQYRDGFRRQASTGKLIDINACVEVLISAADQLYCERGALVEELAGRSYSAEWASLRQTRPEYVAALANLLRVLRTDAPYYDAFDAFAQLAHD